MYDDGYRLSFSITKDSFNIVDNLSGESIINVRGNYISFTLDKDIALQHIKNIQEALMTYKTKRSLFSNDASAVLTVGLSIQENAHFDWSLSLDRKGAKLKDNTLVMSSGFDKELALRTINKLYADLLTKSTVLNPKRDIVRRIVDAGLLVWVHKGNSVVVYEKNVTGNYMINCMFNGMFFPVLVVSTCKKTNSTTLFNSKLEEIATFPLDQSIMSFYPCDDEAFE